MAICVIILALATLLMLGKDVLIPIVFAILLSFALAPIATGMQRFGIPAGFSVAGAVLMAITLVAGTLIIITMQVSDLAADLPAYKSTIKNKIGSLSAGMGEEGIFSRAANSVAEILDYIRALGENGAAKTASTVTVVRTETGSAWSIAGEYLLRVLHPLFTFIAIFLLSAFMLAQRRDLRNRVIRLLGADDIQQTTAALDDAGTRVARMLLSQLAINTIFAIIIATGLWLIGLPSPVLWGIIGGIMRFVPYIGAIVGMVPPLMIAFAFDPGWASLFLTLALFLTVDLIIGHVVEPLAYGKSSGLSPTAVVVSATIWAFLWGPVGLILATPLTICLIVLGRHIKRMEFLEILLGDRPPLRPHEIFYQRMLAGDPREARDQALDFLKGRSLATYYDEIALEAIRRAHLDIIRGTVAGERLNRLVKSTRELVQSLEHLNSPTPAGGPVGAEASAAFELVRPDREVSLSLQIRERLEELWRKEKPVGIIYGQNPLDESVALMLSQVLTKHGLPATVASSQAAETFSDEQIAGLEIVILAFVEPLSLLHIRATGIRVRKRCPSAKVLLCVWQKSDDDFVRNLHSRLRFEGIATTISDALEFSVQIASGTYPEEAKTATPPRLTAA